ncbi:type 1 glutamine amidotransferase [Oerskovia turbata]
MNLQLLDPVRVTVVQNSPDVSLDAFADRLGPDVRLVRPFAGDPLPGVERVGDGLVVLGGQMSAYDDEAAPWLPALRDLLSAAVTSAVPTLGICLGAQLLAVAGGGHVQVAAPPGREAGLTRVFWKAGADVDPVLGPLARAAAGTGKRARSLTLSMHADAVIDLPEGAAWLGMSDMYPYQAFRLGSALGVQFHPEATLATVRAWADEHPDVDTENVVAEAAPFEGEVLGTGRLLAESFLAAVHDDVARRGVRA